MPPDRSAEAPRLEPIEFARWLEGRLGRVRDRWLTEVRARDTWVPGIDGLLDDFLSLLVSFLPAVLGPHREQVDHLWIRASELFGATAARRGLAAGEVIDEFQLLREAVIRMLYQEPPVRGRARLSLREILRLNRAIDRGVTHASVGHTDALFFSLFEGSGVPDALDGDLVMEVREQLDDLRAEFWEIVGYTADPEPRGGF